MTGFKDVKDSAESFEIKATYCAAESDDVCKVIVDRAYQGGFVTSHLRTVQELRGTVANRREEIRRLEDDLNSSDRGAYYWETILFFSCECSDFLMFFD